MADQRHSGDLPAPRMDYPEADEDRGMETIVLGAAGILLAVVWFFVGFAIGRLTA